MCPRDGQLRLGQQSRFREHLGERGQHGARLGWLALPVERLPVVQQAAVAVKAAREPLDQVAHRLVRARQIQPLDAAPHDLVQRPVHQPVVVTDGVRGNADRRPVVARCRGVIRPVEQTVGHLELRHRLLLGLGQLGDGVRIGLSRQAQLQPFAGKIAPLPKRPAAAQPRFARQVRIRVALQNNVKMPQRVAEQVGGLESARIRQPVKLPQPQLAQRHVGQLGRRVAGMADEQALQPLHRIGQPVFSNVQVGDFQQCRAAPVGRDIGGQVLLV